MQQSTNLPGTAGELNGIVDKKAKKITNVVKEWWRIVNIVKKQKIVTGKWLSTKDKHWSLWKPQI